MEIRAFSKKQRQVLSWWCEGSRWRGRDAIICDGAVRSGKTFCMGLSFFCWAMERFDGRQFGLCGKTIGAVRRNLLQEVLPALEGLGFQCRELVSRNLVEVFFGGKRNRFLLFGGQDERAAGLIQGVTLAGVLLDEAALMPRSFVEQACARCSEEGARLWFSCNPEGPQHWFYLHWICRLEERNAVYFHFTMEDNPGLSRAVRRRYRSLYSGTFYRRFILGEWAAAQGLVYDFFGPELVREPPEGLEEFAISCDYGTRNPASFGLWGRKGEVWYRLEEFYYDSRREGRQRTDGEYAEDIRRLAGGRPVSAVVVDPSAASFLEELRRRGWPVKPAENDVLAGIRLTADLLKRGRLVIGPACGDSLREFGLYCWDERFGGQDRVRKEHDHAMDDIRYFAATVAGRSREPGFAAGYVERRAW